MKNKWVPIEECKNLDLNGYYVVIIPDYFLYPLYGIVHAGSKLFREGGITYVLNPENGPIKIPKEIEEKTNEEQKRRFCSKDWFWNQ